MIELAITLFIFSFIACSLLTKLLIPQLTAFGLVDKPSSRRAHKVPTPRGGGLAIVIVFVISFIAAEYWLHENLVNSIRLIPIFLLISIISFLDDVKTIPVVIRLFVHLVCAGLAIYLFLYPTSLFRGILFHAELPIYLDFALTMLGLAAFLNIYNFLDGIDGITTAESIHLAITMLILCYLKYDIILNVDLVIIIASIMLACGSAFIIFNWHPAKIFLGDSGSISMGFLMGLCLLFLSASSLRLFAASVIASLYYLADGGLTILIRLMNKEKIWQPHLKHFFQKAVKNGKTHKQVVARISFCNLLLMVLAASVLYYPITSIILAPLVVMITLINLAKK